ncbi:MAG: tetratricopeptide repeat protein [Steroidobacter sp.]
MPTPATSSVRLNRLLIFVEHHPANLALRKDAIREAFNIGHWDTARRLIDEGLRHQSDDASLLALSGFSYLQAHHYGDAEEALTGALLQGLDVAEVKYNLAFVTFEQKRYEEALLLLTPAVTERVPLALQLRARCLHHLGRRDEAIEHCRAHLAIVREDAETHGLLGLMLYERSQFEAALPHMSAALANNPRQLEAMLVAASLQSDSKNYDTARALFDELLHSHPECGRGWLGLALIELTQLQVYAAKRNSELATTYMPDHIGGWHVLAWTNILLGDILSAELAFDRALSVDRNFCETHGGLAVIAAMQGRDVDARVSIKRALRLDPQSLLAQYAQMLLLQRTGRHTQAQQLLNTVLGRTPERMSVQHRDLVAAQLEYMKAVAQDEGSTSFGIH